MQEKGAESEDNVYPFSMTSLVDLLNQYSNMSDVKVILGFVIMVSDVRVIPAIVITVECTHCHVVVCQ